MNQQYAGYGARFLAALLDGIIIVVVSAIIATPIYMLMPAANTSEMANAVNAYAQPVQFILSVAYYVVYQAKAGQTLGKKVLGIKVVTLDGKTPTMFSFVLREIVGKFVSAIILMIGYLMPLWDAKKQALHDKIAGTIVIKVGAEAPKAEVAKPTEKAK